MTHTKYVHTNGEFKITCDFTGDETPTGIKWYKGGDTNVLTLDDKLGSKFTDENTKKQAVLTKTDPSASDDGSYTCTFQFTEGTDNLPSDDGEIIVARE